jgi:positive regulator of sigma E activity
METSQILTVVVIIAVLFLGYGFFTRYSRAKAKQSRDPAHLVTKIYISLNSNTKRQRCWKGGT